MKSKNPKVIGSICQKHPELGGLRAGVRRGEKYSPGSCVLCHIEKARVWKQNNKDKAREIEKRSKLKCRVKAAETQRIWKLKNPEKVKASDARGRRKYYDKNKEVILSKSRERYQRQIEKERARGRERVQRVPYKYLANTRLRQAIKLRATPAWANKFFMEEAYHLAALRSKVFGFPWEVDHIVPLRGKTVCGLHVHHNLQVIPASHNMSKGNRRWPDMPEETKSISTAPFGWTEV